MMFGDGMNDDTGFVTEILKESQRIIKQYETELVHLRQANRDYLNTIYDLKGQVAILQKTVQDQRNELLTVKEAFRQELYDRYRPGGPNKMINLQDALKKNFLQSGDLKGFN